MPTIVISTPQDRILPTSLAAGEDDAKRTPSAAFSVCDEVLIASLTRNQRNLETLFARYSKLVFSIALRILRDASEAEEVVQEVFLYLYQKAQLFDPEKGSGRAWIVQIAYHRAFDRRTWLERRHFYAGVDLEGIEESLKGTADPEREAGLRFSRERMQSVFADLSDRQRRTLEQIFFEGMDFSEIAERSGEPIGNIRHYYYRGLDKLRKNSLVQKLKNG